jgi:glucose/arabinose dehydrogenase
MFRTVAMLVATVSFFSVSAAEVLFAESSEQADFELTLVADGLGRASSINFIGDDDALISVWQGGLWRVATDTGNVLPVELELSLADGSGLRTVTPHPAFASNNWLYFCFANGTEARNQTQIARGRLVGNRITDPSVVFKAGNFSKERLHQSCTIVWDTPTTFLLALGDRSHHLDKAQARDNYYGVIVRLNDDGTPAATGLAELYADTKPGVWSYGHRNMQGFTQDPVTGELWAHEHGPKGGDEINRLREGLNYGWPSATFGIDYDDTIISETPYLAGTEPPIYYWYPSIAPSGMAIYQGSEFPDWNGDIFVGGLASHRLHRLERYDGRVISEEELLADLDVRLRDVRLDAVGRLFVLTDEVEGRLFRIQPATSTSEISD